MVAQGVLTVRAERAIKGLNSRIVALEAGANTVASPAQPGAQSADAGANAGGLGRELEQLRIDGATHDARLNTMERQLSATTETASKALSEAHMAHAKALEACTIHGIC